jgi:hypothetical protein
MQHARGSVCDDPDVVALLLYGSSRPTLYSKYMIERALSLDFFQLLWKVLKIYFTNFFRTTDAADRHHSSSNNTARAVPLE